MRQVRNAEPHHVFTATEDSRQVMVIGRGRQQYLWVGPVAPSSSLPIYVFGGQGGLRKLALAILAGQRKRATR